MKLQRMDSGKQCKFQHYKYNLRFRHQYEAKIQPSMKKNHNERSKQKGHENIIITGIKSLTQPITANRIIKLGGTSNQILLANGDTIDKDQLEYEPIENARYSAIAYGFDNAIKPKFTGTPTNTPLNTVLFAQMIYVGAVGSGKTTLLSKLIEIFKQKINPFILYFSNFGADETMALNLNSKNIILTNITYDEAMYFLPQFDEIKYQVKEIYTYWKLSEVNVSYKSDFIKRIKERILIMNPIKQNPSRIASATPEQQLEKPKDYARRIAQIFRQECINIITKYSVPTMIMKFTIPAIIYNVLFERKIEISQDDGDAELKVTKITILFHSLLLNSLLIIDDIGSNADIQRISSGLAKTLTHLVSDSRYSKNTVFFVAQLPSYLFKTARILSHVMRLGVNLSECDLKQADEENSIQSLDFDEFMLLASILYYGSGTTGYGELWCNMNAWITIGCDPTLNSGSIAGQWSIYKKRYGTLNIVRTADQNTANKALQISADGNTLSFNGRVL
ncbi:MAG: hypothetical protein EZS28_006611 [Streblomastix strix]|uniref:Uncharacterized protein n=1 Tax=Streblomastix strix TaxID=222440 RepID=A0A5J4WRZ2_9EUKA|nr:MAG: hypothetical protein EZS28_006611 [Streblomastix strix]